MLFLQKTTPDGRFTVSITSNVPEASFLLVQESARSLKELSDMLAEGSRFALTAAIGVLEKHGQPVSVGAVDPVLGVVEK